MIKKANPGQQRGLIFKESFTFQMVNKGMAGENVLISRKIFYPSGE